MTDNASPAIAQMNAQLKGLETNTKSTAPSAESKSAWDNYSSAVGAATMALGVYAAAGQALELVDQGENVHAVRMAFEALQGGVENAADTMDLLREATSGVVSDVDLMSATNRLQSMGLGDTAEEFSELIGMAQQLGSVMSPSATTAQNIDNFTLLLANQSVRRLDSFGISADAVRQRIEELKDAGMSAQEAFNVATLEQGRIALANLGDAATVGATNVDRLSTSITNNMDVAAEWAAGWANAALETVDTLGQISAAQEEQLRMLDAYVEARRVNPDLTYEEFIASGGYTDAVEAAAVAEAARAEAIAVANTNHGQIIGPGAGVNEIVVGGGGEVDASVFSTRAQSERAAIQAQMLADADAAAMLQMMRDAKQEQIDMEAAADEWGQRVMVGAERMGEAHIQAVGVRDAMTSSLGEMDFEVFDGLGLSDDLVSARAESAGRIFSTAWNEALNVYGMDMSASTTEYAGIETDRGSRGGQQLFTQEEADSIQHASEYYNDLLSDAQQLHEAGLITDGELANVQSTADAASALADNAERGAQAFANMNLSQMLGQESGGRAGEITADVIDQMVQSGQYSDSQIAQYQQQLELGTGQQTASSINYDEIIVPMIADIIDQYGAEAGVQAIANMNAGMTTGAMAGMTDEQIAAAQAGMTGYGYQAVGTLGVGGGVMGSEDKTMGGLTVGEVADFDIDAFMQSTIQINQEWATIDGSTKSMADNLTAAGAAMDPMLAQVSTLRTSFMGLNGARVTMRASIVVDVANEGYFEGLFRRIVENNGGTTPGTGHPGGGGP